MEVAEQLIRIEERVQQLLKEHQSMQKEAQRLQQENLDLRTQLAKKDEQVSGLQQKLDALKLTMGSLGDQDSRKELEKRIDSHLREIDKCLSLLNA